MDIWTKIALMLVIPAAIFLITAAVVSGVRMSRREARKLLLTGLALTPLALLCVWLTRQPWLRDPWSTIVDVIAFGAGFTVYYAVIVGLVRGTRWIVGKKNTRRRSIFVCCVLAAVAVLILVVAWFAYQLFRYPNAIPEAYAAWDTGALIVEYMDTHEGEWPRSWDELLSTVSTPSMYDSVSLNGVGSYGPDVSSLQNVVSIDWTADPAQLVHAEWQDDQPPFRVVTRKDGSDFPMVWEGAEPNEMIWRYLRKRAEDDATGQSESATSR